MSSSGDKSEKPTPGKLRKAREKGDLPRSKDLTMAAGLLASFFTLAAFLPYYQQLIRESFAAVGEMAGRLDDPTALNQFMLLNVWVVLRFIATLIPIPLCCIVASLVPGGWIFTPTKLKPDFKKLSPISGIKRMFSASHYTEVGKMLLKCGIILTVLYMMVHDSMHALLHLQQLYLRQAIGQGFAIFRHVFSYFIAVIVIFALLDVPLSKFMFTKKMRMTKQEVKEEYKNNDGNPQIKGRIRQLQRQMAMGQIARTVPTADVIITNPTHYAVALKYDPHRAEAPYIVAKGIDDVALWIREVGANHNIEVVEFPPLARAVYYTTRVNQQIPTQLFRAIAHVLTYVMQLKSWREGNVEQKPRLNRQINIPQEVLKANGEQ
ncbi:flagellar biosynthesis protein FlhB [Citrobacter koseri]|uniref:flagellar biosynthesis protein FlhB n=1 Tax=Citrobacter koseri TaxID=545 RepID=UPI001A1AF706|nr:flagellar biosynthesis protein FlhB [Citrobacter koseri]EKW5656790.1 flagellar type III secretion system protein FlhB [Citrobacter koseri]EKY0741219.1 flagellar type III secretion system protein FlhB [Citrobacter koseri]HAT8003244.1 flagellar type III secretion system protein FlhB [Citrobacter koseri]HBC9087323.1 flagellar type III secretion system protein FlhB [Citrobacter koseri]HBL6926192.1 flagellar type III secretion system protein FlhB [Citrobacter koseri]